MRHGHWHGYGRGFDHGLGGWGIGMVVVGSLLVLLLVLLAVVLLRSASRTRDPLQHGAAGPGPAWRHGWTGGPGGPGPGGAPHGPTPEQLLAERFARGEIDEEEYRRRLATLRSANGPGGEPGEG
ncbi:SHOCT domain-containing protein [Kitasatospora sp. NPDC101183]|uniref:SHOCT domain-containing protein n=1 Tax=Kitasatospora sp. NPDC101183 TaxID=3364100 RepID=UPI0038232793